MLLSPSPWGVILLRCATGVALAAVYPPAMKMAASWFRAQRGLALGLLIGALTLGKAVPYLITTLFGDAWRLPMALASGLAVLGGVLVLAFAADGPYLAPATRFDPHAIRRILSIRGARAGDCRLSGPHVGALRDVDVGRRVFARPASPPPGSGRPPSKAGSRRRFSPSAAARRMRAGRLLRATG